VTGGRFISYKEAAAISGLSVSAYKAGVKRGHFPGPIMPYKKIDSVAMHKAMDKLSGINENVAPADDFEAMLGKGFSSNESSIGKRKRGAKDAKKRGGTQLLLPCENNEADIGQARIG